jgi:hypothetical protein
MHGRGYVSKGVEKAALYLGRKYKEIGLSSFKSDSSYLQEFSFAVNTFPGDVKLMLQKKQQKPGVDFLVHEASNSYQDARVKIRTIDLRDVKDTASWNNVKLGFREDRGYLLKHADTVVKYLKLNRRQFAAELPKALFLVPKHGKLTWSVGREQVEATIFYVEDTVMPRYTRRAAAKVEARFIPDFKSDNVIGFVPGTDRPDSFIVISAHFDHLGKMGKEALFPGAHDNASGTALMLYLATWFKAHPQRYSIAFIGFSGEEAGLVGSEYFTEHPLFPLSNIGFVVNLDMTGDASDGITVVNAVEQKEAFSLLNRINSEKKYLPKILERNQTQNSDHYHFSKHGVPAIFIYSMGAKGYYHDVFDKAQELSLANIDMLSRLLIDFTIERSGTASPRQ